MAAIDSLHVSADQLARMVTDPTVLVAMEVLGERQRQVTAEGYAAAHDDEHDAGELAAAAACYALANRTEEIAEMGLELAHELWPWTWLDWKPSADHRRDLVRAAALLLAEIERLDRAARAQPTVNTPRTP